RRAPPLRIRSVLAIAERCMSAPGVSLVAWLLPVLVDGAGTFAVIGRARRTGGAGYGTGVAMSDIVRLLNQLLEAALDDPTLAAKLPLRVDTVELTPDGGRVAGELAHSQARGRLALDVQVRAQGAGAYAVEMAAQEIPEQLGAALEAFRE